jgi:hypothetical protein
MVGTNPTDFLLSKASFLHSLQSLIVVKTGIRDEGGTETELDIDLRSTGNLILDNACTSRQLLTRTLTQRLGSDHDLYMPQVLNSCTNN